MANDITRRMSLPGRYESRAQVHGIPMADKGDIAEIGSTSDARTRSHVVQYRTRLEDLISRTEEMRVTSDSSLTRQVRTALDRTSRAEGIQAFLTYVDSMRDHAEVRRRWCDRVLVGESVIFDTDVNLYRFFL